MIDYKKIKFELLQSHHESIIKKVNYFYETGERFTLRDLIEPCKYNAHYINKTKGIIENLIFFNYVEIVSLYNNHKNYVFVSKKKIE